MGLYYILYEYETSTEPTSGIDLDVDGTETGRALPTLCTSREEVFNSLNSSIDSAEAIVSSGPFQSLIVLGKETSFNASGSVLTNSKLNLKQHVLFPASLSTMFFD